MKIVQYEESATWKNSNTKKCNMEIVKHKKKQIQKITTQKSATWK